MKRGRFLKSLFTLIAAPSVIGKMKINEPPKVLPPLRQYPLAPINCYSKRYISAIDFLDKREINPSLYEYDEDYLKNNFK